MARQSIVDKSQVTPQELLDVYVIENAKLKLELQAYKMMIDKLIEGIKELEESLPENSEN